MNALGRGLASLIPQRDSKKAEDVLEQIDSMEEITDEAPAAAAAKKSPPTAGKGKDKAPSTKVLNVSEEFEDIEQMENVPMPPKPNVTPLTIDPDTGALREATAKEAARRTAATALPGVAAGQVSKKQKVVLRSIKEVDEEEKSTPPTTTPPASKATEQAAVIPSDEKIDAAVWERHEERVENIPIGDIEVNANQPRKNFDPQEMEELVQSIDQHGILQPLVVLRTTGGGYELVAGERRLRAAKQLKWDKVPCVVRTDVRTDQGRLEMALTENIQRENLNPVEEALGYQKLNEEFGLSHEEIGARVGRSRVAITNIIRVLQLPTEVQRGLAEGKISAGHARAILMIPDEEKQIRFYNHLLDERLTVRKAETRARRIQRQMKLNDPLRKKTRGRPALALKYDGLLEEKFGANARVKFDELKNRFEVVFHAFSEKEAEELISRLLGMEKDIEYPEDKAEDQDEVV